MAKTRRVKLGAGRSGVHRLRDVGTGHVSRKLLHCVTAASSTRYMNARRIELQLDIRLIPSDQPIKHPNLGLQAFRAVL